MLRGSGAYLLRHQILRWRSFRQYRVILNGVAGGVKDLKYRPSHTPDSSLALQNDRVSLRMTGKSGFRMTIQEMLGMTIKKKILKSGDFRILLWFALSGGGSRGSRTPDPLLVRQTL